MLHLHAGAPLEDQGGPCTRVFVPGDGGFRARVVSGGAGKDFVRLYEGPAATVDDLHEALTTLEDTERTARRVMGRAHPLTAAIEHDLRDARAVLGARETPPTSG